MTYDGIQSRLGATDLTIILEARQATTFDDFVITPFLDLAAEVFLLNSIEPTFCGKMMTHFENEYDFLTVDPEMTKVTLDPAVTDEVGVYTDAKLKFRMNKDAVLAFSVAIEVTIL